MAVLTTTALAPVPAHANPPGPSTQSTAPNPPNYKHVAKVSVTAFTMIKIAAKLKDQTKGKTLDYRKAQAAFGKGAMRVSWRRQYAAGWKLGGGKLTHVSSAELKKIAAEQQKYQPRPSSAFSMLTNCTGRSGSVKLPNNNDYPNVTFLDSCETNKLVRNLSWCVGSAGLLAAIIPHPAVAAIAALFIFGCGGSGGWISTAQSNSSVNAVKVSTGGITKRYPEKPTPSNPVRYQVPVKVQPQ